MVTGRIRAAAERLHSFPRMGHAGVVPDTFEWNVRGLPYIIVYELQLADDEIMVLNVFHGAQDRSERPANEPSGER
jgi:plasmid stabilization system protein ParE